LCSGATENRPPCPALAAAYLIWIMVGFSSLRQSYVQTALSESLPMRLSIRTNLAVRALMFCAVNLGRTVRKQEIASACHASENHLAQVINQLARDGFLQTTRGRTGGMTLAASPERINLGTVIRTMESSFPFAECMHPDGGNCPLAETCRLKSVLSEALDAFYTSLDRVSLQDLVQGNSGLQALLRLA
jgi:Rrf2 family transcriptional regulator, nitric oxide-sensitive transcriptional repressor